MKIGRYEVKLGGYIWVQTHVPTTVRNILGFIWIFREARIDDADKKARYPRGTRFNHEGRSYLYVKAGSTIRKGKAVND